MRYFKKKYIFIGIGILVVAGLGYQIFKSRNSTGNIQTDRVKKQDLKLTVLTTGQVVSSTDLDLSFKTSGIVERINVKEGDRVQAGASLAALDQKDANASLVTARGSLAQAQANYQKVVDGASGEDVAVAQRNVDAAQVTLDNAKQNLTDTQNQQAVLVGNAYSALLNSTVTAAPNSGNAGKAVVTVSGTYTGTQTGAYTINIVSTGAGMRFYTSGIESADGQVSTTTPIPLGKNGLFVQFSSDTIYATDNWTISIPNTKASNYVTNANAYQAALQTQTVAVAAALASLKSAQSALDQQTAQLNLKKARARPADVAAAEAQILSAQGQVQTALAVLENTVIRAPASGTVTSVDAKVGELATALKEVIILQDVSNLHVEADVSEANIAQLKPDQNVDTTFDALGPDKHFPARVQTINPGATVISGVVNYKVKASLDNVPDIKPGMTANLTILIAQKGQALAIPQRAVMVQNGKQYARIVDDPKKKTYHLVEIQTGLQADGGLVEITSGLKENQEIVTFIKQ